MFDYCSRKRETTLSTTNTPTNTDTKNSESGNAGADALSPTSDSAQATDTAQASPAFPTIRSACSSDEILARIAKLSQRGRLPGFEPGQGDVLFTATVFGQPFDKVLETRAETNTDNTTTLHFEARLKPILPWTFGIMTALTIWPGVWLTDELLVTYFQWYDYITWMWYLPITVLPLPWMARSIMRKSEAASVESTTELIERIRAAVDGCITNADSDTTP